MPSAPTPLSLSSPGSPRRTSAAALEMRWASALSAAVVASGGHITLILAPTVRAFIRAGLATPAALEEN
ncbi:hypothetical protein [Microbacterium sp. Leaf161]|uniref:hypothetical protein n=1 Tax=Microbacterium sp. Leaf161 TaxID=1736281 RepID=UPI000A76E513|nr:hypothetical protein [Microbacterium sp. Leaf161]